MTSQKNKLQSGRAQKQLLELVTLPGNNICADCKTRNPRWASHNLGIFICMHCASVHRKIGTHITKVKSLTLDDWTKEQIENMKSVGNIKSNAIYNPNEPRFPPPPNVEDAVRDSEVEQYIRAKYQYKKFMDKAALVASKLGPSRSVSSVAKSPQTPPTVPAKHSSSSTSLPKVTAANASVPQRAAPVPNATSANIKAVGKPSPLSGSLPGPISNGTSAGVWNDLCSLAGPSKDSSLPLQFQPQGQSPMLSVNPGMNLNGYTPAGANGFMANAFQAQQIGFTSVPQQQRPSNSYIPSLPTASSTSALPNWATVPQPTTPMMPQPVSPATSFFPSQPQPPLQMQLPSTPGLLSPSPSGLPVMSAPAFQTQFLSPSPSQQLVSHSPQLVPSQAGFAIQPSTPVMSTQFGMGVGPNMSFGLNSGSVSTPPMGQLGFLSTTTMQMQQQQVLMQQQAQQQLLAQQQQLGSYSPATQQGIASNGFGGVGRQMYIQGQQWGPM